MKERKKKKKKEKRKRKGKKEKRILFSTQKKGILKVHFYVRPPFPELPNNEKDKLRLKSLQKIFFTNIYLLLM